jgi:hypothetical protein
VGDAVRRVVAPALAALLVLCACQQMPSKHEYKRCVDKTHWEHGCRMGLVRVKQ